MITKRTMENKNINYMELMIVILGILILSISFYLGVFTNKGYYKITDMWIGDNNKISNYSYCDNCLWIEFDEGCNRRFKYFFENQHEYDSRLKVSMPVDVKFREVNGIKYMRGVIPRKEYDYKCSP